jgi:hypothetical protein
MTTTDLDRTATCPAWCSGLHSSVAADDRTVEIHEGQTDAEHWGVSVTLTR